MKRTLGTLSALVLAMRCAFAATPAELSVVAFEGGAPAGADAGVASNSNQYCPDSGLQVRSCSRTTTCARRM